MTTTNSPGNKGDYNSAIDKIKAHVEDAIKFGFNVNEIAPHSPQKYLDQKGKRGVKKINPAWKKLQDLEKSLTSVKPKKINKRKVR